MNIEIWHGAKSEVEKLMTGSLPHNGPVLDMIRSGARGSVEADMFGTPSGGISPGRLERAGEARRGGIMSTAPRSYRGL